MQTQIDLFKKLSIKLGEDTATDLVNYITENKEEMDDRFLTQKDKWT